MAWGCAALLLGHTASRAASTALIWGLSYAGDLAHAKAKPLAQSLSTMGLWVSCAWVGAVAIALVLYRTAWFVPVVLGLLSVIGGAVYCARWLRQRLGGYTGDTLGATQQVTEVLLLLTWSAIRHQVPGGAGF